jgi:hypothetical protein
VDQDIALLVGGLSQNDFTVAIYDPDGYERSDGTNAIEWSIGEKYPDSGYYVFEFAPDTDGDWLVSIIHSTYFPWGKSWNYKISYSVTTDDLLVFILGLY